MNVCDNSGSGKELYNRAWRFLATLCETSFQQGPICCQKERPPTTPAKHLNLLSMVSPKRTNMLLGHALKFSKHFATAKGLVP